MAGTDLDLIASAEAYPKLNVAVRWGQILRESRKIAGELESAQKRGLLVPLRDLATLRGGVVTRANAYFIVEELSPEEVPEDFRLTRGDYKRIAVVRDGLDTLHRIEREFLKPIIKGPEMLLSPATVAESNLRLVVVDEEKKALKAKRATGALDYLRRGERVSYNVSADTLKGGIPAKRSQIENRKPYWYSLSLPETDQPRIVIPEHADSRYIAVGLKAGDDTAVNDKLFIIQPRNEEHIALLLASLNSLLAWYQFELKGRTQLGQGVLELKKPELQGTLVLNPEALKKDQAKAILEAFEPVRTEELTDSFDVLGEEPRTEFDELILRTVGWPDPERGRLRLERELRAAASERKERRESIAEARRERRRAERRAVPVDAFAERIASRLQAYPDPRESVPGEGAETISVAVEGSLEGVLSVGDELFNQGDVLADGSTVAKAPSDLAAQYVKAVLTHDRGQSEVEVPVQPLLEEVMRRWRQNVQAWKQEFERVVEDVAGSIDDERARAQVCDRALILLKAE